MLGPASFNCGPVAACAGLFSRSVGCRVSPGAPIGAGLFPAPTSLFSSCCVGCRVNPGAPVVAGLVPAPTAIGRCSEAIDSGSSEACSS